MSISICISEQMDNITMTIFQNTADQIGVGKQGRYRQYSRRLRGQREQHDRREDRRRRGGEMPHLRKSLDTSRY